MSYIEFNNVIKEYTMGEVTITALDNTNFSIEKGELVVIVGPSGAGKTTTLNLLGGMDTVSSGEIIIDGKHIENLRAKELTKYRREDIGFVFQFYNLVQNLTAKENVELALQTADRLWVMETDNIRIGTSQQLAADGTLSSFIERKGITFDKQTMTIHVNRN